MSVRVTMMISNIRNAKIDYYVNSSIKDNAILVLTLDDTPETIELRLNKKTLLQLKTLIDNDLRLSLPELD